MSPSSVRSEGGEAAAGYCLDSVSYRVDEAVKYNVLNSEFTDSHAKELSEQFMTMKLP